MTKSLRIPLAGVASVAILAAAACGPAEADSDPAAQTEPVPSAGEGRTLTAPPDLVVGEWWSVEVDPALVDATFPTTLVVTHREGDRARIGIPPNDFSHDFLVLHIPVLGDLELTTFAWRVMWDDFEALRFPLEEGREWSADFHGFDVDAEVTRVEGSRAYVTMVGEGQRIELVYDADMGMITDFREEALQLAFRVTDHGFGYAGEVLSPAGIELGMMARGPAVPAAHHGDAETMGDAAGNTPGNTSESVEVDTDGSHGSLNLVVWNQGTESEAGRYSITATAPDGETFDGVFEVEPGSPSVLVQSFGHDSVRGTWRLDFHRGGPAGLLVELFTYQLDVVRPEGR